MGGASVSSTNEATRRQIADAWRAVGNRLVETGYNPNDVAEIMLSVALAAWSGSGDLQEAAEQLRATADYLTKPRAA